MTVFTRILSLIFLTSILWCASNASPAETDGYLTGADGAQLYYKTLGTAGDTIFVVQGGPGADMNSVLPAFNPLAQKYVLIFYDQRGGGKSELPADTSKLHADYFIEDLKAVQNYFRLEKANIITHSFGSVLVASYAQKYPERINRIVFHGATGPQRSEAGKVYQQKAAISDTTLLKQSFGLLKSLLSGSANDPIATCREYEAISQQLANSRGEFGKPMGTTCEGSAEAVRYYYQYTVQLTPQSFGNWDFTGKLTEVSVPVLVIYGKSDSLAIAPQEEWARVLPNSRLLLVPKAWKGAMADNPEFVFSAIDAFFSGNWPEGSRTNQQ